MIFSHIVQRLSGVWLLTLLAATSAFAYPGLQTSQADLTLALEPENTDSIGYFPDDMPDDVEDELSLDSLKLIYRTHPVAAFFVALPDSLVPLLSQRTRLDMLDYAVEGQKPKLKNALGGMSWLDSLTNDYLKVRLTTASSIRLAIFRGLKPAQEIVVMNYTIKPRDAAADSQLLFFTTDMKPIPYKKVLKEPVVNDFIKIPVGDKTKKNEIAAQIPFPTIEYLMNPTDGTLKAILTVDAAMTMESFRSVKPFLSPELTFKWTGKKFDTNK